MSKVLILALFISAVFTQNATIDSLNLQLKRSTQDVTRLSYLNRLASAYRNVDINQLRSYALQAEKLARSLENQRGLAEALQNLSIYYTRIGETDNALSYAITSERIAQKINDRLLKAYSHKLIGSVYYFQSDYKKALEYYKLALNGSIGDATLRADMIHNIALIYMESGSFDLALDQYQLSLEAYKNLEMWEQYANNLSNIGITYEQLGKYEDALEYYQNALDINQQYSLNVQEATVLNNIGWLYEKQKKFIQAKTWFEKAIQKANETDTKYIEASATEGLYNLQYKTGDFQSALRSHVKFKALQDQLFSIEREKQIAELRTRFESERIEQENTFLKRESDANQLTITAALITLTVTVLMLIILYRYYRIKQQTNEQLEKTIQERTNEIQEKNRKLQELVKNLEFRKAEMERYAYAVSHDLKSPLITINGLMGIIERELRIGSNKRLMPRFKQVNKSVVDMHNILDDLLEYINVGQIISHPQRTFVGEILDSVIKDLRKKIIAKKIKVDLKVNGAVALTDPQRLREVFFNLIDNAIKFSSENSTIEVGSEKTDDEITMFIKDNGLGINKEYHNRIFEMFERLSSDTDGTGIGLSICKRIVEIQGGKIWVNSDGVGKGSTFYFTIPRTQ